MAHRAAATNCALLITGETGVGKGHLAKWIHEHSSRRQRPFVPVNCGAIPEGLVDSHLFGHARGAFSGASADHLGLIRAADGGTLLLDEIGDLPATAQVRLLRLLEEREVQPVGFSRPVSVNVRIVAATSGDLSAALQAGSFREDLFFRLDVVRLEIKPLRERRSEIAGLLESINEEFAAVYRQPSLRFDAEAMGMLQRYDWPGNIRELRAVVERLHVLCGPTMENALPNVGAEQLRRFAQLRISKSTSPHEHTLRLHTAKLDTVSDVIEACRGNISRAASTLGVHRSTIYRWMSQGPLSA